MLRPVLILLAILLMILILNITRTANWHRKLLISTFLVYVILLIYATFLSRSVSDARGRSRTAKYAEMLDRASSMRWDGSTAFTTYSGGTTGERFVSYLKDVLIPTLQPGDIVVMDHMRSHHMKVVEETLRAAGIHPLYLPPLQPCHEPH